MSARQALILLIVKNQMLSPTAPAAQSLAAGYRVPAVMWLEFRAAQSPGN
jgi:hypothetical protein